MRGVTEDVRPNSEDLAPDEMQVECSIRGTKAAAVLRARDLTPCDDYRKFRSWRRAT